MSYELLGGYLLIFLSLLRLRSPDCPLTHCVAEDDFELLILLTHFVTSRWQNRGVLPCMAGKKKNLHSVLQSVLPLRKLNGLITENKDPHPSYVSFKFANLYVKNGRFKKIAI